MSLKLVPFESLGVVSYLPSIVTMAVSVAVCEIFSVKQWRDLENQVRNRSRLLKMAPFDRPYATFYRSALGHCTYSSILYHFRVFLTLNNIMTLKSGLEITQSLKLVPLKSLGAVSYSPSNYGRICSHL